MANRITLCVAAALAILGADAAIQPKDLSAKCAFVQKAIDMGQEDYMKRQAWYTGLKRKCQAIHHPIRESGEAVNEKKPKSPKFLGPHILPIEMPKAPMPVLAKPGQGNDDGATSWSDALSEAMLRKRCELLAKAKSTGNAQMALLAMSLKVKAVEDEERRCEELAAKDGPKAPPENGAWAWNTLANNIQQLVDTKDFSQLEQVSTSLLRQKCAWLEKEEAAKASNSHRKLAHWNSRDWTRDDDMVEEGYDSEDDEDNSAENIADVVDTSAGRMEERAEEVADWASNQEWFNALRAKCDSLLGKGQIQV